MKAERYLRGYPLTVTKIFYNGSTPVNADGAVAVVVKKADGTTAYSGAATGPVSNVYSYVIPAQTNLNNFTITWSGAISGQAFSVTSDAEIVGGFTFELNEIRNYDTALTDVNRFPDTKLVSERVSTESEFEDITGWSFTPRFAREEFLEIADGYLITQKALPNAITKFYVDGVDRLSWITSKYITFDINDPHILNVSTSALSALYATQIEIEYEHGWLQVPAKIRDAALRYTKINLLGYNSSVDERATTLSVPEFGTMTLATPGRSGYETGIPGIDAILHRFSLTASGSGSVF